MKDREIKRLDTFNDNYKATIDDPYLKENDIEFWFENIYDEFADSHFKKKKNEIISRGLLSKVNS